MLPRDFTFLVKTVVLHCEFLDFLFKLSRFSVKKVQNLKHHQVFLSGIMLFYTVSLEFCWFYVLSCERNVALS